MGHIRLGALPRTRDWDDVVELVTDGADAASVAALSSNAANAFFERAAVDAGFLEATWLLTQLPQAARKPGDGYLDALRGLGLNVEGAPSVLDLSGAISEAVDARMLDEGERTDVGEIGRLAAVETLTRVLSGRSASLFGTTPEDVRRDLASLATTVQFGALARDFFARFTSRLLTFFLSRELANHVGGDRRFGTMLEHAEFNAALALHCQQAARIVEDFSGEWMSKARWENRLDRESTRGFVFTATQKLRGELARRGPSR